MSLPSHANAATGAAHSRYDPVTIAFHWLTAALVVFLFGSAFWWSHAPRALSQHRLLENLHVSFGITLVAVIVLRFLWRLLRGRRLPMAVSGLAGIASKGVHFLLYLLVAVQLGLGFSLRWMQGEALSFFGLFSIPGPFTPDRAFAHQLQDLHNLCGWAIVIVAGGHALMALIHHYALGDGVLRRMLPAS